MKTIAALDLRKNLGSVLSAVATKREPVMISRANKPLAVLMSVAEYEEKVLKSDRGRKLRDVVERMEAWRRAHRGKTAGVDAAKAVREIRDRR